MKFDRALKFILWHEGGYVNDPKDPGGETNFGISKRQYPEVDIKNLTKGHAAHIYEIDYWVKTKCPGLPPQLRLPVFDTAVNQGAYSSILCLQKTVDATMDGIIGNQTLGYTKEKFNDDTVELFLQNRIKKYLRTPNFNRYGKGWLNRVLSLAIYNERYGGAYGESSGLH